MISRGFISRAAATACLLAAAGTALAGGSIEALGTEQVANGLLRPVGLTHAPGDFTRVYIHEKRGIIKVLNIKTGVVSGTNFLNIDSIVGGGTTNNNEQGLLGLAFHPDFQTNRYFYVNYTNNSGNTVIARYTATTGDVANAGSAFQIMTFAQPESNHNGGWIGFGPNDGYLYIATGDGGGAGDNHGAAGNGQDITNNKLGKILRIDVDGGSPYAIPPSNPFVGVTGDDEIWVYGLRNPWRCSFDRATGDLYMADVGQNAWEEISYQRDGVPGGRNYGWRCREGAHNYNFGGACGSQTLIDPFHEYSHSVGSSITGGYVYRGCDIPTLRGTYFFADYVQPKIFTVKAGGTNAELTNRTAELDPPGGAISTIASFGEDARGEIYIVEQVGAEIWKVVPEVPTISEYDLDCNGFVDFNDLLQLLANWGDCDGCQMDFDGNHITDFSDLLGMLANWG